MGEINFYFECLKCPHSTAMENLVLRFVYGWGQFEIFKDH